MNIIESNIIGKSQSIAFVKSAVQTMAQYAAPVLITGETGTGKELVARGLHYNGSFANKPFIAINCSTFTDELFASELFGYKKGAFTDAKNDKDGLLVSADGGTIFLDEIDSLSPKSQAAILRVLQESEFRPIGSSIVLKANVRFIAAANCNLGTKISQGEFRQDLYFRLYILSINVPALRERKEDIPLLIEHFVQKLNNQYGLDKKGVSASLLRRLSSHNWPGNVRELENTIHRYYLMAKDDLMDAAPMADIIGNETPASIPQQQPKLASNFASYIEPEQSEPLKDLFTSSEMEVPLLNENLDPGNLNFSDAKKQAIENFEAKFVSRLLKFTNGNVTKAASLCGKERRAFGKLVKKYHIKNNEINLY